MSPAAAIAAGAGILTALPVLCVGVGLVAATSTTGALAMGSAVPDRYAPAILAAAETCPRVSPAILAAQLAVESGFDPEAVSTAGAQGIAQFTPATWAAWGGDFDADGTNSPFDPQDAIHAQARYLCHLIGQVVEAGLAGDGSAVVQLALAAYNAGIGAVTQHRGIPPYPQTEAYVRRITTISTDPRYTAVLSPGWDGAAIDTALPAGYTNTRTADQAVLYGLAQVGVFRDSEYCLRFVAGAYGPPSSGRGIQQAHQVWDNSPAQLHHPGDFDPPRGAIVLWDASIGHGAGHIAISLGDGTMVTTTRGAVALRHIAGFADPAYLGWMPPFFRKAGDP